MLKKRILIPLIIVVVLLIGSSLVLSGCLAKREHLYLTWQGDMATTMTVTYQTRNPLAEPTVYYDTEPHKSVCSEYAYHTTGKTWRIPGLEKRYMHAVELTNLQPGTTYYFVAGDSSGEKSACIRTERKFRTLPQGDDPVRFVTGGDVGILPRAAKLMKHAGKQDPMFVLIGGDLAYANGELSNSFIWDVWLYYWEKYMVTPEGHMVPMVLAIGNHETNGQTGTQEQRAPFYFGYFPQGNSTRFSRMLGNHTALFVLDSGHILSHIEQKDWLRQQFEQTQGYTNTIAVYHVPLYPAHRDFDYGLSSEGRTHWMPMFDEYKLDLALENHDHVFKRSKILRNNQISSEGTIYLGDGCMGVPPRDADNSDAWYLEKVSGTAHFWVIDADNSGMGCQAVNVDGEIFDQCRIDATPTQSEVIQ